MVGLQWVRMEVRFRVRVSLVISMPYGRHALAVGIASYSDAMCYNHIWSYDRVLYPYMVGMRWLLGSLHTVLKLGVPGYKKISFRLGLGESLR